jgi:hypothetical protein
LALPLIGNQKEAQGIDKQLLIVISEALKAYCEGSASKQDHDEKALPAIENKRITRRPVQQMTPPVISKRNEQLQVNDFITEPGNFKNEARNKFAARDRQMPVMNMMGQFRPEKENCYSNLADSRNEHTDKPANRLSNLIVRQSKSIAKRTYLINSKIGNNEKMTEQPLTNPGRTVARQASHTELVLIASPKDIIKNRDYLQNTSQLSSGRSNKPTVYSANEGVHVDEFKHIDAQTNSAPKHDANHSALSTSSKKAKKQFYDTYLRSIRPADNPSEKTADPENDAEALRSLANAELELKTSTKFLEFPASKVLTKEKDLASRERLSPAENNLSNTQRVSATNFDVSQKLQSYQVFMRARLAQIFDTIDSSEIKEKIRRIVCNSGELKG